MDHKKASTKSEGKATKIFSLATLQSFNDDQDLELNRTALAQVGGLAGVEQGLRTDFMHGLSSHDVDDLEDRRLTHGRNECPEPERQTFIQMFLESFEDTTLIVLIVAAFVSLAVGLYEGMVASIDLVPTNANFRTLTLSLMISPRSCQWMGGRCGDLVCCVVSCGSDCGQ